MANAPAATSRVRMKTKPRNRRAHIGGGPIGRRERRQAEPKKKAAAEPSPAAARHCCNPRLRIDGSEIELRTVGTVLLVGGNVEVAADKDREPAVRVGRPIRAASIERNARRNA